MSIDIHPIPLGLDLILYGHACSIYSDDHKIFITN